MISVNNWKQKQPLYPCNCGRSLNVKHVAPASALAHVISSSDGNKFGAISFLLEWSDVMHVLVFSVVSPDSIKVCTELQMCFMVKAWLKVLPCLCWMSNGLKRSFNFIPIKLCNSCRTQSGRWTCPSIETSLCFYFDLDIVEPGGWLFFTGQYSLCLHCSQTLGLFKSLRWVYESRVFYRLAYLWSTYWEPSTKQHRVEECQSLIGAISPCLIRWNFLAGGQRWGKQDRVHFASTSTLIELLSIQLSKRSLFFLK